MGRECQQFCEEKKEDMNQCLRCNQPCSATSLFCDECRSTLPRSPQSGEPVLPYEEQSTQAAQPVPTKISPVLMLPIREKAMTTPTMPTTPRTPTAPTAPTLPISNYDTAPMPTVKSPKSPLARANQAPQTPLPMNNGPTSAVEQALHRLSDAARRISGETGHGRTPRASRLKPLHDISADIQRQSTPHPSISDGSIFNDQQGEDLGVRMPDLWPWFQNDAEETDAGQWQNYTDPLQSRHLPGRAEAASIEAADIQRAIADGLLAAPFKSKKKIVNHLRLAFICLTIMAVLALGVDSVLLSFTFLHHSSQISKVSGPPTLSVSLGNSQRLSNVVEAGQVIILHLRHFTSSSNVYVSHDVDQPVMTNITNPKTFLLHVDQSGNADATTTIDNSWEPGFHTIQAEDSITHYTASATLQIQDGHTRPSQLQVETTTVYMGAKPQGANSSQSFTLSNQGTGSITWSANSNRSWLLLTPNQGTFSQSQTIIIGVQRIALKPGDYSGKITFTSNVGNAGNHIDVTVTMRVQPLSVNAPVLEITPAVLSFTASDGGNDPNAQYLVVSNPGKQPLHWSLSNNSPTSLTGPSSIFGMMDQSSNWLSLSQSSGSLVPDATTQIGVLVHGQNLLPGTYINTLVFGGAPNTTNSPQNITVSLTVQPSCGVTLNTGSLAFTAVVNQNSPGNQALSLSTTASCPNVVNWQTNTSAGWLSISPGNGQITQNTATTVITVGVSTQNLKSGTYTATIAVVAGQNSQTVLVTLTVQPPLPPSTPVMAVSQLSLNFSTTQGQSSPPGQSVTISNTANAGSSLHWNTSVATLASSWLGASPAYGIVAPGQTDQLSVTVNTTNLTPGNYVGQIVLNASDGNGNVAGGSPQTIMINLTVLPPCALAQPSSSTMVFSTLQGSSPSPQSLTLTASGNCSWPLSWKANIPSTSSWLSITPTTGTLSASGQSTTLVVSPSASGLAPGTYSTLISVAASDTTNTPAQGSPQSIAVTLTVAQPCTLQTIPATSVSLTMAQGATPPSQTIALSETGSCAYPVSWAVTGDSNSASWLVISSTSGSDSGTGSSFSVSVNLSATLTPGTYKGILTITASGTGGAAVNPQTLPVTLVVTGYSVSGVVDACTTTPCATPTPLGAASVSLVNTSGTIVMTTTANSAGAFSFSNVAVGTYAISASGTDSAGNQYTGSTAATTIVQNTSGIIVDVYTSTPTPTGTVTIRIDWMRRHPALAL